MNRYLLGIIVVLLSLIYLLNRNNNKIRDERNILKSNQGVLLNRADYYQTKDSLSVASIERLILTNRQLKENYEDLNNRCEELNIKLNNVNSLSVASLRSDIDLKLPIRDTVIIRDSTIHSKFFRWEDSWSRVEGIIYNNSIECKINTQDTIIQIVHRVPKKILFFRFGTKAIRQEILSCNPNNRIVYNEYISLKNI